MDSEKRCLLTVAMIEVNVWCSGPAEQNLKSSNHQMIETQIITTSEEQKRRSL